MADRLDATSPAPGDRADAIRAFSWSVNGRGEVDLSASPDHKAAYGVSPRVVRAPHAARRADVA